MTTRSQAIFQGLHSVTNGRAAAASMLLTCTELRLANAAVERQSYAVIEGWVGDGKRVKTTVTRSDFIRLRGYWLEWYGQQIKP